MTKWYRILPLSSGKIRSNTSTSSPTRTVNPVSSRSSRSAPSRRVSPSSSIPPGIDHCPSSGGPPRLISRVRPPSITTPPTPTSGRSGYSRFEVTLSHPSRFPICLAVYNTPRADLPSRKETWPVTRCPECDTEIDLDEDEVEEGEIVGCSECDAELEVTQTHPVHLIKISDDDDEDDEEEEASEEDDDEEDDEEEEVEPDGEAHEDEE